MKKLLKMSILCLLVGMATNVIVASALGAYLCMSDSHYYGQGHVVFDGEHPEWQYMAWKRSGGMRIMARLRLPDATSHLSTPGLSISALPAWTRVKTPAMKLDTESYVFFDELHGGQVFIEEARGWPYASFMGIARCRTADVDSDGDWRDQCEYSALAFIEENDICLKGIPYRPIWVGIIVNSAIYAVCCWVVVAAVRSLINKHR